MSLLSVTGESGFFLPRTWQVRCEFSAIFGMKRIAEAMLTKRSEPGSPRILLGGIILQEESSIMNSHRSQLPQPVPRSGNERRDAFHRRKRRSSSRPLRVKALRLAGGSGGSKEDFPVFSGFACCEIKRERRELVGTRAGIFAGHRSLLRHAADA